MRARVGTFEPAIDPRTGKQRMRPLVDPHTNRWVRDEHGVVIEEPVMRPVIRFHDLRHTYATTLARSGHVTIQDIQNWMGHADLKTTWSTRSTWRTPGQLRRTTQHSRWARSRWSGWRHDPP